MTKILFPTDFSEASKNAFVYALQFADAMKAELITLHVYELPVLHAGNLSNTIKSVYDTIELENFENFKSQVPLLRKIAEDHHLGHVNFTNVLKDGDLVWVIRDLVEEEKIDFVIMGTKGATGLKETFMGSNTGSVITDSEAYVIGIPDNAKFKKIENITFTTRFREKDKKALERVVELAKSLDAKVNCIYVAAKNTVINKAIVEEWNTIFKNKNVDFIILESNNVKTAILDYIESHNVGLLAMLHYKRGFFEELFSQSLTQKLSYHSNVPILAMQESKL